jgi:hypothetical protein
MKTLSNRAWMGPSAPVRAILGDLVRFVALALLAGIGFALFLAMAVVMLTLAAPDASAQEWPRSYATGQVTDAAAAERTGSARHRVAHLASESAD